MSIVVKESPDGTVKESSLKQAEKEILMEPGLVEAVIKEKSPYEGLTSMDGTSWYWAESKSELPDEIKQKL